MKNNMTSRSGEMSNAARQARSKSVKNLVTFLAMRGNSIILEEKDLGIFKRDVDG